jgi:hypothetical protein
MKAKREKFVKPRIIYGEYHIQHADHCPTRFDVYKTGKEGALIYGATIPQAVEYIALRKMSLKTGDKTLKEFITEFRGLVQEIKMAVGLSTMV